MKAQVNKQEKIRHVGPQEIILGAVLGVLIGLLLSAYGLINEPVTKAKEKMDPKEIKPGVVYYTPGDSRDSGNYGAKIEAYVNGAPTSLHHGELNKWASTNFKPSSDSMKGEKFPPRITPMVPNFRIKDSKLQLSAELWVSTTPDRKPVYQAIGTLQKVGNTYHYVVERSSINSMPVPPIMGLPQMVFNALSKGYLESDEGQRVQEPWNRTSVVKLDGERLTLAAQ